MRLRAGASARKESLHDEMDEKSVCAKFAQTAPDGKTYPVDHYNLDAIISGGYRGKSACVNVQRGRLTSI